MDQVSRYGQIMPSMKESGGKTKQMEGASSGMLMEIYMRGSGRMIRLMDMVFIYMLMGHSMRDIGRMICRMDRAWSHGRMEVGMKEDIRRA